MSSATLDSLVLVGANVSTAPRDGLAELEKRWLDVLGSLGFLSRGVVVLATCNRFEVYLDSPTNSVVNHIASLIESYTGRGTTFTMRGLEAARHLFRVASGLESQIIGDHEVLGQVRKSWLKAREEGFSSPMLDEVFHRAVKAGARARSETGISRGGVGYSHASVYLAERVAGGLDGLSVGIVGAGMAAVGIARHLCSSWKPRRVEVFNRTLERGFEVVSKCPGVEAKVKPLKDFSDSLENLDVVFIAIGGTQLVVSREEIVRSGVKVIVDISNPPVTPVVEGIVFHMPHVEEEARAALNERLKWVPQVERIIDRELEVLADVIRKKPIVEASRTVMRSLSLVASREVERTLESLKKGVNPYEALEIAINSYTKKVARVFRRLLEEASARGSLRLEDIEEIVVGELARASKHQVKNDKAFEPGARRKEARTA